MKVRLTSRRSADARCAYCHDGLDGVLATCPRCVTTFHKDCRAHLAQCPTLGCGTTFTTAPEVAVDVPEARGALGELLDERMGTILVGVLSLVLLSALFVTQRATQDVLVVGGFLALGALWSLATIGKDLLLHARLAPILARPPVRMTIEMRSEARGAPDDSVRVFTARLMGAEGQLLTVELGSSIPAWLLAPGPSVEVFFAEEGPIALRSTKGHTFAVAERNVTRHI